MVEVGSSSRRGVMSKIQSGLKTVILTTLGIAACQGCGGQEGLPTPDDSIAPFEATVPAMLRCFDPCGVAATSLEDVKACEAKCGLVYRSTDPKTYDYYQCVHGGGYDCFGRFVVGYMPISLGPYTSRGNDPPRDVLAPIPAAFVGTWVTGDAVLTLSASGEVVFDNHAPFYGCEIVNHMEGTAGIDSDGLLWLISDSGTGARSQVRGCNGQSGTYPGRLAAILRARMIATTKGDRLTLDDGRASANAVYPWGHDYYYRKR